MTFNIHVYKKHLETLSLKSSEQGDLTIIKKKHKKHVFDTHPDRGGDSKEFIKLNDSFKYVIQHFEDARPYFSQILRPNRSTINSWNQWTVENRRLVIDVDLKTCLFGGSITFETYLFQPYTAQDKKLDPDLERQGGVDRLVEIKIVLPKLTQHREEFVLNNQGAWNPLRKKFGDLIIQVNRKSSSQYELKNSNLHLELPTHYLDLLLGGTISIPLLEGGQLDHVLPSRTKNNTQFVLSGYGAPTSRNSQHRGDLVVTVIINTQENLTKQEEELYRKLNEIRSIS